METYDLLDKLLNMVEDDINNSLTINELASQLYISPVHLQRLFKFAFGIPIASYIRSRRLSASIECLLKSDLTILGIASQYGFPFEQSYIRAFKREFGATPAQVRKTGRIIKVTPPLRLSPSSKLSKGILFNPEFVIIPKFHVIGKQHIIPFVHAAMLAQKVAKDFWKNDRHLIPNVVDPDVYYGLTRISGNVDYSHYLTSVRTKHLKDVPSGFDADTFETSLCVRFHYIGKHHYYDINADVAHSMYNAIRAFANDENARYGTYYDKLFFERIDTGAYDGTYCMMEWFTPVYEK